MGAIRLRQPVNQVVSEPKWAPGLGDPQDPGTQMGPLISAKQRELTEHYVKIGLDEGARIAVLNISVIRICGQLRETPRAA
jgi:acyl-CoA reductase-like NAD-dependent aldehyde dehydrogenase